MKFEYATVPLLSHATKQILESFGKGREGDVLDSALIPIDLTVDVE